MLTTPTKVAQGLPEIASSLVELPARNGQAGAVLGAVIDPRYRLIGLNSAYATHFAALFGAVPRVGDDLRMLISFRPALAPWWCRLWERALAGEEVSTVLVMEVPGQRRRFFQSFFQPLRDRDGDVAAAVQIASNVTEAFYERARLVERGLGLQDGGPGQGPAHRKTPDDYARTAPACPPSLGTEVPGRRASGRQPR